MPLKACLADDHYCVHPMPALVPIPRPSRPSPPLQTYLADLAHNPDNPWSVRGLNQTLERAPTALAALKAQVMTLEQQQQGQQQAGAGAGADAAAALQVARERLKGTEAAVAAARAAYDGASARTRAAAERLQSSCPAFSTRHM